MNPQFKLKKEKLIKQRIFLILIIIIPTILINYFTKTISHKILVATLITISLISIFIYYFKIKNITYEINENFIIKKNNFFKFKIKEIPIIKINKIEQYFDYNEKNEIENKIIKIYSIENKNANLILKNIENLNNLFEEIILLFNINNEPLKYNINERIKIEKSETNENYDEYNSEPKYSKLKKIIIITITTTLISQYYIIELMKINFINASLFFLSTTIVILIICLKIYKNQKKEIYLIYKQKIEIKKKTSKYYITSIYPIKEITNIKMDMRFIDNIKDISSINIRNSTKNPPIFKYIKNPEVIVSKLNNSLNENGKY